MSSIPRVSSTASQLNDFVEDESGKKMYQVSKSRLVKLINWVHVFRTYLPIALFIVIATLIVQVCVLCFEHRFDLQSLWNKEIVLVSLDKVFIFDLGWKSMALFALIIWFVNKRDRPIYLVDFACFEPPEDWKVSPDQLIMMMKEQDCFNEESLNFSERMLKQSGVGPKTAWPPSILKSLKGGKSDRSVAAAREESESVMFDVVDKVLKSTNTNAKDIDILVVNCSLFSPTPSLCSMIINNFEMRSDISSYNLSGMGCSAGLISIELVKNLLASRPNSTALVVSTENLTQNLYRGNNRGFLLQNTLFRCGGAAIILSNKWTDAFRASFKLLHCVRTQYVTKESYGCVYEDEDEDNERGVRLSKEIVKVAGRAMEKNFATLGPHVLPLSEQIKFAYTMFVRFLIKKCNALFNLNVSNINPYIPDFKRGIDFFCIHAGGRAVIDGIEKNLKLSPAHVEASRHALYTYGNTSSSSIWYEMDYIRKNMDLYRGQRVLQIAFGSGFKCNSGVWLCINNKNVGRKRKDKNE